MKPFNLEEAKAGKPVCTTVGHPARILCFDKLGQDYPVLALIKTGLAEEALTYTIEGRYDMASPDRRDLVMAPVQKTVWVNLYRSVDGKGCYVGTTLADTEQEALDNRNTGICYIGTFPIHYEE